MLLYVLLAAAFLQPIKANCPPNYSYVSSFDMCYLYVSDKTTFNKAQDYCHWNYGYLATVSNGFLNNYLSSTIESNTFIGYQSDGSSFYWDSGIQSPYINWAPGQGLAPSNGLTYAYVKPGTPGWYQGNTGGEPAGFICEAKPVHVLEPTSGENTCIGQCNNGYTMFGGNCKCYKMDPIPRLFTDAEAFCNNDGAHIVKIDSSELNSFLLHFSEVARTLPNYPWIGLYCPSINSSACTWADGTVATDFLNFKTNMYPNQGTALWMIRDAEGYVFNGQWQTAKGVFMKPVVCQQDPVHISAVFKVTSLIEQ